MLLGYMFQRIVTSDRNSEVIDLPVMLTARLLLSRTWRSTTRTRSQGPEVHNKDKSKDKDL